MSQEIILWIKTSIYGLVLLGALSSIFAVVLLKISKSVFRPMYTKLLKVHFKYSAMQNWILGGLSVENNGSKIAVYLQYHLMTFIFGSVVLVIVSLILILRLIFIEIAPLNIVNVLLIITLFLTLYFLLLKIWTIRITYQVHVLPVLGGKYKDRIEKVKKNSINNENN